MKLFLSLFLLLFPSYNHALDKYNDMVERVGEGGQYVIPAIGLIMTIKLKDWEGTRECITNGLIANLTTCALKYSIHSERPNHHELCSFPSGHTTMAFYGAGFIKCRYGWKYAIPAFIGAVFVGYSRVQVGKHWTRDVVGGAAVGLITNWLFTTPYRGKCRVYPCVTKDSCAICCDYEL